ncbi:multicopper oxidase family protein [Kribbella sindirgiensis]|uniref:Multicopper oxidase family protein n=1 Tax=Kribbella sindirgiensis TaxID=1124744 RepID=A0A4R0I1L0_9ACTN|nr:multicopper oxidase family protein [Kribbella sindirgiensis]TCC21587.1 multicopper oxidase family protein [Kribbella sindirgiensis]
MALSRRRFLSGAAGAGLLAIGGCRPGTAVAPGSEAVRRAEAARRTGAGRTISTKLTPRVTTLDLGGPTVDTWAYGDSVPGPVLRARAGDLLRVDLVNQLPAETTVHWHGVALRNDMDGVPGMTQQAVGPNGSFRYEFTVAHPGTYFYHPHVGVQLDRGLYGVLIVDDPEDPGQYDAEWILVLDDWVDGTGRTPDQVLASLDGMHMGMGDLHGAQSRLLGGAGDVAYPYYLANGRVPSSPVTFTGSPGQRVRLRVVNAGADTAFRLALGGHRLTITHTDGFPVRRRSTDAILIGMGERVDLAITLGDGVFPLVALAEGKTGTARAVVRTSSGPAPSQQPAELNRQVLLAGQLLAATAVRLPATDPDRTLDLVLGGGMMQNRWTINGKAFPDSEPLSVEEGERVRLRIANRTMMFHPVHVHGHTFGLADGGARKDTVIVRAMDTLTVDLTADNPGQWATHCHNIYHAERGMMTALSYRTP